MGYECLHKAERRRYPGRVIESLQGDERVSQTEENVLRFMQSRPESGGCQSSERDKAKKH